jgi:hypothetical protein
MIAKNREKVVQTTSVSRFVHASEQVHLVPSMIVNLGELQGTK